MTLLRFARPGFAPAAFLFLALARSATAGIPEMPCVGDCDTDGNVSTAELVTSVRIALGELDVDECGAIDPQNTGGATVDQLVLAVNEHLNACGFVTPTPTATPVPPDLVPDGLTVVAPPPPEGCVPDLSTLPPTTLEVCVRNDGTGDAPAFQVQVAQMRVGFLPLQAGQRACVITAFAPFEVTVTVDPDDLVAESNEDNNSATTNVPVPTPPLVCTATPTETPLPFGTPSHTRTTTATPTDTATVTPPSTGSPTRTATPTSSGSPTPSPTPSRTPGLPDLVPNRITLIAPTPIGGCINDVSELVISLEVCVGNDGTGPAGPFRAALRVAGAVFLDFAGVAADSEVCIGSEFVGDSVVFEVDTEDAVVETHEDNNQVLVNLPRPTRPPLCATPTPTPSE